MIDQLTEFQSKLMEVLDVPHTEGLPFYLQPSFREAMIGCAQEALETHEAAGAMTKPWKSTSVEDVKEELIDVLFYWLEAVVISGLSPKEIESIYLAKYLKNLKRVVGSSHADESKKFKALQAIDDFEEKCVLGVNGWEQILLAPANHAIVVIEDNE